MRQLVYLPHINAWQVTGIKGEEAYIQFKSEQHAREFIAAPILRDMLERMDAERTKRDGSEWLKHPLCKEIRTFITHFLDAPLDPR
mgnify:CR=1 FL=1